MTIQSIVLFVILARLQEFAGRGKDLLRSDEFERLNRRPSLLREELLATQPPRGTPVIVDEVQEVPALG